MKRRTAIDSAIAIRTLNGTSSRAVLRTDSVLVGCDPSCDIRFDALGVSRLHLEIYRVGDLWWVRDLGSEDGTFLDGDPIEAAPVAGVVVIELGERGPRLELTPDVEEAATDGLLTRD